LDGERKKMNLGTGSSKDNLNLKDASVTGRSRSAHFNNPFRASPSTPGGHRARKPTNASTGGLPVPTEDPNILISNLGDLPENSVCADCGLNGLTLLFSSISFILLCVSYLKFRVEVEADVGDLMSLLMLKLHCCIRIRALPVYLFSRLS